MLKDKYRDFKLYKIIFSIAIGQIITSVLIAPIAIHLLYKKFGAELCQRHIKQAWSVPLYGVVLFGIVKPVSRACDFGFLKIQIMIKTSFVSQRV